MSREAPVVLVCSQCGSEFSRPARDVRRGRTKFCGQVCAKKSLIGKPRPDLLRRRIKRCAACGTEMVIGGRTGKTDRTKFCSMDCQRRARRRRGKDCNVIAETTAAYIAGIIDGEGSVMLLPRLKSIGVRVTVANTDKGLLNWLSEVLEVGNVYQQREESATHRASFSWRSHGDGAATLLKQIVRFLRVKRTQAELAIRFHDRLSDPTLKIDVAWQNEWMEQIRAMNKRGPKVSTSP